MHAKLSHFIILAAVSTLLSASTNHFPFIKRLGFMSVLSFPSNIIKLSFHLWYS